MKIKKTFSLLFGFFIAIIMIFPLYWMISLSLMSNLEIYQLPVKFFPKSFYLENYKYVFNTETFLYFRFLLNTILVAALGGFGTAIGSSLPAYAFSKLEWKGRDLFLSITIATLMIPEIAYIVPRYLIFNKLNLIGTYAPMWLPSALGTAFNIFLFTQFFKEIPKGLSEAAIIDGCNHFQIYSRIVLPLGKNSIITVVTLHFVWAWKELMTPMVYFTKNKMFTLSLGLKNFVSSGAGAGEIPLGAGMAAAFLTALPVLILFLVFQKNISGGIATTGTKG